MNRPYVPLEHIGPWKKLRLDGRHSGRAQLRAFPLRFFTLLSRFLGMLDRYPDEDGKYRPPEGLPS